MTVLRPSLHRRPISTIATVVLLAAVLVTLVHWHADSRGQRCEICFARSLPGIHVPFAARLAVPIRVEWWSRVEKPITNQSTFFQSKTSRAPPRTF